MNKVVTLCNSEYFKYSKLFIQTRHRVDAKFIMYGPDLNPKQIHILEKEHIIYKHIDASIFNNKMQYLKFEVLLFELNNAKGVTFADADTYFCNDWVEVFDDTFDLGITVRTDMIKDNCLRAFSNGGVIFAKNTPKITRVLRYAMRVMNDGKSNMLKEYDEIWNTLESKFRPAHKRHFRTNLRCWCDQVFLSAIALSFHKACPTAFKNKAMDALPFSYNLPMDGLDTFSTKFFNCDKYNHFTSDISAKKDNSIFIKHLKQEGRKKLTGKTENLLGA